MRFICLAAVLLGLAAPSHAGVFDFLKKVLTTNSVSTTNPAGSPNLSGFSQDQLSDALRQALTVGVQNAVTNLGRPGGFLDNAQVRIPMPEKLQTVEKALRAMKQDRYADEFVATMNHAAEQAVPAALPIFTDALRAMTVDDARQVIAGGNDSGTQFFKKKGEKAVQEKLLPVVQEATAKTGVTSAYKKFLDQAKARNKSWLGFLDSPNLDVDSYVTQKASDGLFKTIADEEKRIRENPAARTTELLRKVFGAVGGTSSGQKP